MMTEEKNSIAPGDKQRRSMSLLPSLLLLGGITEFLYILVLALTSLPGLHFMSTPLMSAWSWTLAPSHWLFPSAWTIKSATGSTEQYDWLHAILFAIVLFALIGTYVLAILVALRRKNMVNAPSRWFLVILGAVLVFSLTLLFQPTLLSDDVFSYIFSGRMLSIYHVDPLNTIPAQFPGDPYLQWVIAGRNTTNIYGPLWLYIASLLVTFSNNPVVTLLLFKGVAILSHIINCLLLWAILGKIAPTRRLLGTLLYAWNPLILLELAGSGHSDGVLITLFLLATWLYVQNKGRWRELAVIVILGFAISMNFIALLIAPLFFWFLVRSEHNVTRSLWGFCWRMCITLFIAALVSFPLWRGESTFFALTSAVDMSHFEHSPVGLLTQPTRWFFGLVAQWANFPPVMQPTAAADTTLRASTIFIFALIFFHLFGKVRHATTTIGGMRYSPDADQQMNLPGFDVLLDSWYGAVFWYLVLLSGWFWPWYVLWALWIVALRRFDGRTMTILLLSCTALLSYPLQAFAGTPIAEYQSLLVFGIPLIYIVLNRMWWKERHRPLYE
ncbi:MAG TPA: hypothetical protein VNG51_17560 [Ktedonobacteraceae bacterium]|nr:hypothetical protein [Ktedonobacteraceae bacterium]